MNVNLVKCVDCEAHRGIWCVRAKQAGLHAERNGRAEISRTLSQMEQRCPAFVAKAKKAETVQ